MTAAAAWLALSWAAWLAPAHAGKRVALVVGNDHYANFAADLQLQKAVNDARAVAGTLRQLGFEVVSGENLGRQALIDELDEATRRVSPGDMVFFFFSGHGIAVDGINYVLPADVPVAGAGQVTRLTGAAIREDDITAAFLRAGAGIAVMVLDACRNNPFAAGPTRGIGGERGLAPHDPPNGVFILYSAGRGQAALDRLYDGDRNPNSVFTRVLLPALARSDLDLPELAITVRDEVTRLARSVNYEQRPAYYDETSGGRVFLTASPPSGAAAATPAPAPPPPQQLAVAAPAADRGGAWSGDVSEPGAQQVRLHLELNYAKTAAGIQGMLRFSVPGHPDHYVVHRLSGATLKALAANMTAVGLPPSRNGFWCERGLMEINELRDGTLYVTGNGRHGSSAVCMQWFGTLTPDPSAAAAGR